MSCARCTDARSKARSSCRQGARFAHRREPLQPLHRRPPGRRRARRASCATAATDGDITIVRVPGRVGDPAGRRRGSRASEQARRGDRARRGDPRLDAALRLRRRRGRQGHRAASRCDRRPGGLRRADDRHDRAGDRARRAPRPATRAATRRCAAIEMVSLGRALAKAGLLKRGRRHGRPSHRPRGRAADALRARGVGGDGADAARSSCSGASFELEPRGRASSPTRWSAASSSELAEIDERDPRRRAELAARADGARRSQHPAARRVRAAAHARTSRARSSSTRRSSSRSASAPTDAGASSTACSTGSPATSARTEDARGPPVRRARSRALGRAPMRGALPPDLRGRAAAARRRGARRLAAVRAALAPPRCAAGVRGKRGERVLVPARPRLAFEKLFLFGLGPRRRSTRRCSPTRSGSARHARGCPGANGSARAPGPELGAPAARARDRALPPRVT